ncbi:MAG: winged helix-turn-helix transcriptional regulator [Promethearchaeota archaeon]
MNTNSECSNTEQNGICFCPIEGVIEVLSKKWALVIIGTISNHKRIRFNELIKDLTGISPRTLSMRLKELEKAELIKRESFPEIPPRVEYTLTQDGIEVKDAMIPLMEWAHKKSIQSEAEK